MRLLAVLVVCVVGAVSASATVDPDVDQIGIYFDLNAEETCLETPPYLLFWAYMIVTNPSAEVVQGIDFSLCARLADGSGSTLSPLGATWYASFVDTGEYWDWCDDGRVIYFLEPVPFVDSNVPLVRIQYLPVAESRIEFYLGPCHAQADPGEFPAYLDGEFEFHPLGVSSGDPNLPVAVVNGDCDVVSITGKTFGDVKSLFR